MVTPKDEIREALETEERWVEETHRRETMSPEKTMGAESDLELFRKWVHYRSLGVGALTEAYDIWCYFQKRGALDPSLEIQVTGYAQRATSDLFGVHRSLVARERARSRSGETTPVTQKFRQWFCENEIAMRVSRGEGSFPPNLGYIDRYFQFFNSNGDFKKASTSVSEPLGVMENLNRAFRAVSKASEDQASRPTQAGSEEVTMGQNQGLIERNMDEFGEAAARVGVRKVLRMVREPLVAFLAVQATEGPEFDSMTDEEKEKHANSMRRQVARILSTEGGEAALKHMIAVGWEFIKQWVPENYHYIGEALARELRIQAKEVVVDSIASLVEEHVVPILKGLAESAGEKVFLPPKRRIAAPSLAEKVRVASVAPSRESKTSFVEEALAAAGGTAAPKNGAKNGSW